jgi:hypothetical protein
MGALIISGVDVHGRDFWIVDIVGRWQSARAKIDVRRIVRKVAK